MLKDFVNIYSQLYKCRDSMEALYKDEFPAKVQFYIDMIEVVKKRNGSGVLQAILWLDVNIEAVKNSDVAKVWLFAAAIEMIENGKDK